MFQGISQRLIKLWLKKASAHQTLDEEYKSYISVAYPSNHTFKLRNKTLIPKSKLAARYQKILKLFPDPLTSLMEIGCSKGFFVLSAANFATCTRCLGIDVNSYAITVCNWLKEQLNAKNSHFAKMQLHELAARIDEFGGPFQVVLIQNTYQYLYFGSDSFPTRYLDHEIIFQYLSKICNGRIIFNNRTEINDCQNVKRIEDVSTNARLNYSTENLIKAASPYFAVKDYGKIGRYPLLAFDVK